MIWNLVIASVSLGASLTPTTALQQGGTQGIYQGNALQQVEQRLGVYLNAEMQKSILTPGESVDWPLTMKAGDIVVGEAQSDSFDPAAEILDDAGKKLAENDDRYPGDQRPLLFWRCVKDGAYTFRVRSYQGKAGGQVFARFNTYATINLNTGPMVEAVVDATKPFMARISMKAGQVMDFVSEKMGEGNYLNYQFNGIIYSNGLPERAPSLSAGISPAIRALVAPLDSDYYIMYSPVGYGSGSGRIRLGARVIPPVKPNFEGTSYTAKARTQAPALFEINVKPGDLLEASTLDLNADCALKISEAPDLSGFAIDPKKPELNPFFPRLKSLPAGDGPALDFLPKRARDGRIAVFRARRNAKLWIASDGAGPVDKTFTLQVKPAAMLLPEDKANERKLQIANTDYWAFDAKAGDVMTLNCKSSAFSLSSVVRDPDLAEIRHFEAALDQTTDNWKMIVQKPGIYVVGVACGGNGGGGDYTVTRNVLHATEFTRDAPAKGEIVEGQTQVWKFKANPKEPLFVHWNSADWSYDVAIYDDHGNPTDFQREDIDDHRKLGILKVAEPTTYIIVLTGKKGKVNYSIELNSIPARLGKGG